MKIKDWTSFNEGNVCEHPKESRKNLSSFKMAGDSNSIEVECGKCGMHRYETRHKNDRIDISKWFRPRE